MTFGFISCLCNVMLCMREALGISTVHNFQVMENGENWDGRKLLFY